MSIPNWPIIGNLEEYEEAKLMVEAHSARGNVGDWKLYYLWFPRRFDGVWHWCKYIFRRKVWKYDYWYEYSFFPLPETKVYYGSSYSGLYGGGDFGSIP